MTVAVDLSDKEALGVYLLLSGGEQALDVTMARLLKRIEDRILKTRTVEEYQDPAALYRSLPERGTGK